MADSELFLIAHKVRGQLAFDVATPIEIGETDGWIIPTSGHRAYPFWVQKIENDGSVISIGGESMYIGLLPESLRDHYHSEPQSRVSKPAGKIASIDLSDLGL